MQICGEYAREKVNEQEGKRARGEQIETLAFLIDSIQLWTIILCPV